MKVKFSTTRFKPNAVLSCLFTLLILLNLSCSTTRNSKPTESKDTKIGDIYLDAGTEALVDGKFTEALGSLLTAVKYLPRSTSAWNNLGLAYAAKQEYGKAKECWLKTLDLDEDFSDARNNLGALYLSQRNYDAAEKEFKLVLKDLIYLKSFQANYNLALIYLAEGKYILAEENLKIAVNSNNSYCPAWERLGYIQKDQGKTVAAQDSFHNAVSGPCYNNPGLHFEIASLLVKSGDMSRAKAKFLEIIQLFPQTEWAKKSEANLNLMR